MTPHAGTDALVGGAAPQVLLDTPVVVRVPASSANLGPGFDAVGLALALHDEVEVTATAPGTPTEVEVVGQGAGGGVPLGDDHLVVRALRTALHSAGVHDQPGLRLRCRNAVPHGRGLGSSATAIVSGVVAARRLLPEGALTQDDVVHLASDLEGHADNAAASVLGGMTLGWRETDGRWRAARLEPHPEVDVAVCVPTEQVPTARARAMLPDRVTHADAAFTAGRAALLVEAMTRSPHLLMPATDERLHQRQRVTAMPHALELIDRLRAAGLAAVVSGAGPSVLVLGRGGTQGIEACAEGWQVLRPGVDARGAVATAR